MHARPVGALELWLGLSHRCTAVYVRCSGQPHAPGLTAKCPHSVSIFEKCLIMTNRFGKHARAVGALWLWRGLSHRCTPVYVSHSSGQPHKPGLTDRCSNSVSISHMSFFTVIKVWKACQSCGNTWALLWGLAHRCMPVYVCHNSIQPHIPGLTANCPHSVSKF